MKLTDKLSWLSSQWSRRDLPPRAKLVLFALVERSNADLTCYPSVETLANDCGVSRPTVVRALQELVAAGLIARRQRRDSSGDLTTTLYALTPEQGGRFIAEPTSVHGRTDGRFSGEPTGRVTGEPENPPIFNPPPEATLSLAVKKKSPKGHLWDAAVVLLCEREGIAEPAARGFVAKLAKDHGDAALLEGITAAVKADPAEPRAYLAGAVKRAANGGAWGRRHEHRHGEFVG